MMKKILFLALATIVLAACQSKKQDEKPAEDSTATAPAPAPAAQLTEQQKADGWKLLFDGQTTNGWRFFKNKPNGSWEVVDGTLHCKAFGEGQDTLRADLMTVDQYENFEFQFDWKISAKGNSGVMFRVNENHDQPYYTGPEYQLIDNVGYPGAGDPLKDVQLTGASYDMYPAPAAVPGAIGDWNTSKIVVNGKHVEHWLNGTKVVEYEISSPDFNKRKKGSKWKDEAEYGIVPKGYIDIQDHNHEAWFKNIMIKTL